LQKKSDRCGDTRGEGIICHSLFSADMTTFVNDRGDVNIDAVLEDTSNTWTSGHAQALEILEILEKKTVFTPRELNALLLLRQKQMLHCNPEVVSKPLSNFRFD